MKMQGAYNHLLGNIGQILEEGRIKAVQSVNSTLVRTYWEIGKQIVEYEQRGKERAGYGEKLLLKLSKDLSSRYGRGFSKSNVYFMRFFYTKHLKFQTVSGKLSWSHYIELFQGIQHKRQPGAV